jgi:protein SCO1/2
MRPIQKALTTMLWLCAVLAMVSVIGANMWRGRAGGAGANVAGAGGELPVEPEEHLPVMAETPPFSLVDQNGQRVTIETLRGHPWVASFIFTRCAGPCPIMTAKMSQFQKTLPPDIRLVSVSVDPTNDTPAALKTYAAKFNADDSRWRFLTIGPEQDASAVYTLARGMLVTALPANTDNPIIHSEKFILVDGEGNIRAYYDSNDSKQMAQLKADAAELAGAAPAASTTESK